MKVSNIESLGEQLRLRRGVLDLTQSQAAGLSGVSHRLWSEVERGVRPNVSLGTAIRMLQTLGLDMALIERGAPIAKESCDRRAAP
jgi:transcriptional regulator with XRE-family HTH domain